MLLISQAILAGVNLKCSLLTVACTYFVAFIPQWIALNRILTMRPQLLRDTKSEIQVEKEFQYFSKLKNTTLNPFGVLFRGFATFWKQRVSFVILADGLMHLSGK